MPLPKETPIYATHTDERGNVLATQDFAHKFQVSDWLRGLDIRAGDKIEFSELTVRRDETLDEPLRKATTDPVTPLVAVDEQPL